MAIAASRSTDAPFHPTLQVHDVLPHIKNTYQYATQTKTEEWRSLLLGTRDRSCWIGWVV
eukprot:scaffold6728_cov297-Alexandrium_tamarense.AAC.1